MKSRAERHSFPNLICSLERKRQKIMDIAKNWEEYELLDMANGEKLEKWKDIILVRPDPQIIWRNKTSPKLWEKANAIYKRSKTGGGAWEYKTKLPKDWQIKYKNLTFNIKPMGFKHTGLFPEQAVNWDWMMEKIKSEKREIKVLNLFAYTGGATVACLSSRCFCLPCGQFKRNDSMGERKCGKFRLSR